MLGDLWHHAEGRPGDSLQGFRFVGAEAAGGHPRFSRRKDDLHIDVEVPFEVAALGGEAEVSTMTGTVVLTIPAGSGNGRKIRLGGKGMPVLGSSDRRGDLMATVRPTVPDDLNDEQKELITKYRDTRSVPNPSTDGS